MATFGQMQDEIADMLARSDLTTQIAAAIRGAVRDYEREPWWFLESRSSTFSTVANQEYYTASDLAAIPNVAVIDALTIEYDGYNRYDLTKRTYETLQHWSTITTLVGRPTDWAPYARSLRLYPIPDAAYTIRLSANPRLATLSATADTSVWTEEAYDLVLHRARERLYRHTIQDAEMAAGAAGDVADQYRRLCGENAERAAIDGFVPVQF